MRIGILTSGGDCPGINATIRGVCKTAINHYGMEVVGIHSGFQGLLTKDVESFTDKSLSGLLNQGGTMLGTSREKPFKKNGVISDVNKPALIEQNIKELGLDCVVCIGGNGTQKTAAKLAAMGLNIVSVPKTIDNDIWGTDFSFGFDSAVQSVFRSDPEEYQYRRNNFRCETRHPCNYIQCQYHGKCTRGLIYHQYGRFPKL